jgi:tetratricopeptide (TPR) repeat protein
LFCIFGTPLFAQGDAPKSDQSAKTETKKWREDLRYMAEQMPLFHKDLLHQMTREQFDAAIKKLYNRIPVLARHQIIVEMQRIVAMAGDGHTNIYPTRDPKIGFHVFPVKMYFFQDGLFIRSADKEHADLPGAKVIKIGNATVKEAYDAVREIIGRDNEMDVKFFAAHLLVMPEVLHALRLSDNAESAKFTFESKSGQKVVELRAAGAVEMMPADTDMSWRPKTGWTDSRTGSGAAAFVGLLWLRDPQNKFWYEYLPDSKTVYFQYNQVGNKDNETLAAFSKRLLAFVEANPVERLVIDMRLNRGGNGEFNRPLLLDIIKSAKINQRGKLFAIIGRSTFSAAQFMANNLEKYTNCIFVGEPSGSQGNIYGDSRKITLPNSGMTVRVSVYYWQDWNPWDTRQWTAPEITAELTSEDYRLNRDPAIEAILNYVPQKTLSEVLDEALTRGGIDGAVKSFREFIAEPAHRYAWTEQPLLEAGQRLLNEKKPEQAAVLFQIDVEKNPQSFRAYFALGAAYSEMGKKDLAIANFEKSLQLNPKNYDVIQSLREVKGIK